MPGNASIGERLYLAAVRVCRGSTRRTSRLFVPFATDDIRLCDQTTPHVATIAVVIGRRLASFGFIPSMTALRFMSNFSTQSRTGARDPHIGLLCGERAGIRERFRTPRLLSGWTYPNLLNRFWCLCGQIRLADVVGDHSGCVFPHRAPRGATWDTWAHILWMRNVVGTAPTDKYYIRPPTARAH